MLVRLRHLTYNEGMEERPREVEGCLKSTSKVLGYYRRRLSTFNLHDRLTDQVVIHTGTLSREELSNGFIIIPGANFKLSAVMARYGSFGRVYLARKENLMSEAGFWVSLPSFPYSM